MLGCGFERQLMTHALLYQDVNLNLPEFFSLALRQPGLKRHDMATSEKGVSNETERAWTF
jgi:hypothetical protein